MKVYAGRGSEWLELKVQVDDGLGMAPLRYFLRQGPMQHGATDAGYRLDPRIFSLVVIVVGSSRSDLAAKRTELLTTLSPTAGLLLRFVLDSGNTRQIDCRLIDAPLPYDSTRDWTAQKLGLRFIAPDPTFYNPAGKSVGFGLSGGGDTGEVPTEIPMYVGASTLDQTLLITYAGTFLTHPWRVRIVGPITDPKIENLDTGEKLDFSGQALAGGEFYEIDCRYGQKSVVDHNGTNRIAHLTDDSDLATFHLAPHPEVSGGRNNIRVTGTGATESTEVTLAYYERDLGI